MNNLHTFDEFINEKWINFFNSADKKITNEMKTGQIVCTTSDIKDITHVYQLINPSLSKSILIGNFKISEGGSLVFKISKHIDNNPKIIKNYRLLNDDEKKMAKWHFSTYDHIDNLVKVTKINPIF